jgi:pimeloyl-ACP methyl ester carboxylesterase
MFSPTVIEAAEEPLRVASGSDDLYGMLHHPWSLPRGAVLLCPADGEERAWCLRTYVELARALAERGFWVLRFDYAGQGESAGAYEDASVETRLRDIAAALATLRVRSAIEAPALVGARLGGSLALEAASRDPQIASIVLLEPIVDTAAYARNLIRVNLSMQMVMHEKVIRDSDQLQMDLDTGGYVSANGYNLTQTFLSGVEALRPGDRLVAAPGRLLVISTLAARLPESAAEVKRLAFPPFWREPKADMTPPKLIIRETVDWLDHLSAVRID